MIVSESPFEPVPEPLPIAGRLGLLALTGLLLGAGLKFGRVLARGGTDLGSGDGQPRVRR